MSTRFGLLPFDAARMIQPAERVAFYAMPQYPCLPLGYIGTAHPTLVVHDARIGNNCQPIAAGAFPSHALVLATWATGLQWDPLSPGLACQIVFENVGPLPVPVSCGLFVLVRFDGDDRGGFREQFSRSVWLDQLTVATQRFREMIDSGELWAETWDADL